MLAQSLGAILLLVSSLLVLLSLPHWLPPLVVRLRMNLFTRINGREALRLPGEEFGPSEFRSLYSHPAVSGRSRGARLSDLFWYWLAPGPEMHQEHLESGPDYEKIAELTRSILALPNAKIDCLINQCVCRMPPLTGNKSWRLARLRDMMMPLWADFYYELVFDEVGNEDSRRLIVGNANDVATALKCCGLRHMSKRRQLTEFLRSKLEAGEFPHEFPEGFSLSEQTFYVQGTFFNTAVVQMSDAMAHLLMALAEHRPLQDRLADSAEDHQLYDRVIHETLRLFPLFGIAHRITSADINVNGRSIERGSVICFDYSAFHRLGFDQPDAFQPERWGRCPMKDANHIPFGMAHNRPCPAMRVALLSMRRLTQSLLQQYRFSTSAGHTRSLPNRGPCLVIAREQKGLAPSAEKLLLLAMRIRDRWEDVYRSMAQLVFGTIMVLDARRRRLCENHFKRLDARKHPA